MPAKLNDQSTVVIHRTITVSTEHTLAELAKISGEDVSDVIWSFEHGSGQAWVDDYRVAEMTPTFNSTMTEDGSTIDSDVFTISRLRP